MNLLSNQDQVNKFISLLPELQNDEVYFISLSARQKHLTKEEREYFSLGRTEMMIRTIVRSKDEFPKAFREIEGRLSQRQTRAGKNIPSKCLIVYVNINPSSMVKAYNLLKTKMEGEMFGIIQALQNGNTPNYDVFRRLDRQLMTAVQNATGHKTWLDLDFDVPDKRVAHAAYIKPLVDQLTNIKHCLVETKGGYHLLIDRESLEQNSKSLPVPLHLIVKTINDELGNTGEAVFNKNAMIPFPGFMQAGFEVRIL